MQHIRRIPVIAILLLSTLLMPNSLAIPASAQAELAADKPETVLINIFEALEDGDVDGALALVSDNAVLTLPSPPPGFDSTLVGKEEIRAWWEVFASWNPEVELIDAVSQGNMVMMSTYTTEDGFRALGVAPMRSETVAIVQNGLLTAYTVVFSAESEAKFLAALERETNKEVVRRFYDEIWNNGELSVIDEIIAEDFIDRYSGQNGREAFKGTVALFRNAYPDLKATYTDIVAEGDLVAVYVTFTGTYQGGLAEIFGIPDSAIGTETILNGVDYARIENGVMVEGWGAHDELPRFIQLGFELVPPTQ